jgi:hypothetical protein
MVRPQLYESIAPQKDFARALINGSDIAFSLRS